MKGFRWRYWISTFLCAALFVAPASPAAAHLRPGAKVCADDSLQTRLSESGELSRGLPEGYRHFEIAPGSDSTLHVIVPYKTVSAAKKFTPSGQIVSFWLRVLEQHHPDCVFSSEEVEFDSPTGKALFYAIDEY